MSNPPPIKYVLYSHYSAYETADFEAYKADEEIDFKKLRGFAHLQRHFRGLRELLNSPGHGGLLVLFYAPDKSFENFLLGIEQGTKREDHSNHHKSLCFAEKMATCVEEKLANDGLGDRVRFLTPSDLHDIFEWVNTIFAQEFRGYFIGLAQGIRYDTPKIVEAILRLRLLGNGVPVLRVDHDVLFRFNDPEKVIGDLGLFKAVACAVQAYQLRLAQPTVSTFLFSASYNSKALFDQTSASCNSKALSDHTEDKDEFKAWGQAFATRIYPALKIDSEEIHNIWGLTEQEPKKEWNQYVAKNLDKALARQFYGLIDNEQELRTNGTEGLTAIGAHPLYAVISGALLCLSEGAILDLPPFSNFRNNVMWIDDHLKYSLHRAMHHFTSDEPLRLAEPGLSNARFDEVSVTKARPGVGKLPAYIFGTYLPALLWGAIMDAWITQDSILKCRVDKLDPDSEELWHVAKAKQDTAAEALLPKEMLKVLRSDRFSTSDKNELLKALEQSAVKRIEEVRQLWAKLKTDGHETFASCWAEGKVEEHFAKECSEGCDDEDAPWKGIAPGRRLTLPIRRLNDLTTEMSRKVDDLCEDAINYVEWTRQWPKFVQIVRSIRQGDFKGDLGWRPDKANQSNTHARGPSGM